MDEQDVAFKSQYKHSLLYEEVNHQEDVRRFSSPVHERSIHFIKQRHESIFF